MNLNLSCNEAHMIVDALDEQIRSLTAERARICNRLKAYGSVYSEDELKAMRNKADRINAKLEPLKAVSRAISKSIVKARYGNVV